MIELAKPTREERMLEAEENSKRLLKEFEEKKALCVDFLDEDGYPTDEALDLIEIWHWTDTDGWFKFIEEIWAYKSFGWNETTGGVDDWTNEKILDTTKRFHISTAGWSGNESIIRAMELNWMLWHLHWVQSRRGGHYIFEVKQDED
jgi:hypothetical protein